ncbi:lipopolysaccharide biosynthesis protein [Vibrio sp. 2026]|uniref:lipopolysaccharide biosynthesis protein n=1 Tax=unclassified Vibrio TaxID=2614977 RepID=UPI001B82D5BE|nr:MULTISPECIES: lipopolysaccharide biosynthesis protein [unclassified Vibrio]MDG2625878.1 lipopolysaccharide biosynthesis protein [Vibrio parahaemolyticus]HBC3970637.1 lipopolysaccharide biosynthesis protein [Vibrio alginolyticus]MDW1515542.1 lipopolysaccharide biosynthesis protein [Vibrio sp. Vb5035]MDW1545583.1 lipopolysaccharide biosynthesis protein [Vibrio sp. Vb5034]MDW1777398.1 lipopolysaccharide biosynthesis protein [Vibrio sp. Vb2175]
MASAFKTNVASNLIATLSSILTPIITLPILTSSMGLEDYGIYVALLSKVAIIVVLTDLGLGMYIPNKISVNRENRSEITAFTSTYFHIKIFLGLLLSLINGLFPGELNSVDNLVLSAIILSQALDLAPVFNGLERYKILAIIQTLVRIIFLLAVLFVDFGSNGLLKALCLQLVVVGLIAIIQIYFLRSELKSIFFVDFYRIKVCLSESKDYYFSRLTINLYQQGSTYLASFFLTNQQLSIYSIAVQFYKIGALAIGAVSRVLYTKVVYDLKHNIIIDSMRVSGVLYVIGGFLAVILGKQILDFIFSFDVEYLYAICLVFYFSLSMSLVSSFLGYPLLAPIGKEKYAHIGIYITSIAYFSSMLLFYIFDCMTILTFSLAILISDVFSAISRLYFFLKFKHLYNRP